MLGARATTKAERVAEFKKRKQRFAQRKIHPADREKAFAEGWTETGRQYKDGQVQVEKSKSHDEVLENRFWSVLYHLGYDELNVGRKFKIQITDTNNNGEEVSKQVDVFAKDDDTVVIAECKSSAAKSSASFQKDIMEFAALKKSYVKSVTTVYGKDSKLKFIWLMVTRNIILSANDIKRAEHENIQLVGDRDLRYFEEIARNIGKAAKYQFLAEFLEGAKVKNLEGHQVPAIRAKIGGHQAYYFLVPPERLLPIAFVNHRSLRDASGNPAYQRLVKRARLNQIGQFLDGGGFFPNSILVNFKKRIRFDIKQSYEDRQIAFGDLTLPDAYKTAWIIDGQHRLYGFAETNGKRKSNIVAAIAFENISREMEADLFATINGKQAKVSKNILDELEGDLKFDSEDFKSRIGAIASRSLALLDAENGGPFNDKFKTPETEESDAVCLTISELKKAVVQSGLIGRPGAKDRPPQPGYATRATSEDTLQALSDLLSNYFDKIRRANLERWELGRLAHLCMNIGIAGHIRLLAALCDHLAIETKQDPAQLEPAELVEQLEPYLEPVLKFIAEANDLDFEAHFKPVFGSGGPPRYFYELARLVQENFPHFVPSGLEDYLNTKSSEESRKADDQVRRIIDKTHLHVIDILKKTYGDRYYTAGIPQKEIRMKGLDRQQDADVDEQLDPITYLDVVDLKKIVEHKNNWLHFEPTMNIKMPDDRKGNAKNISWFDTLNDIRKIMAHPANRSYKQAHYEFLNALEAELEKRLSSGA